MATFQTFVDGGGRVRCSVCEAIVGEMSPCEHALAPLRAAAVDAVIEAIGTLGLAAVIELCADGCEVEADGEGPEWIAARWSRYARELHEKARHVARHQITTSEVCGTSDEEENDAVAAAICGVTAEDCEHVCDDGCRSHGCPEVRA